MKIYLDTSVISALFDNSNPERKSLTKDFFRQIKNLEVYVSEITILEVDRTPDKELRKRMKKVISDYFPLTFSNEVEKLAEKYIHYGAVPESYAEDAYHIAVAVINEMDYLLSWNFRHIVRKRTRDTVRMVNTFEKMKTIEIITPAELL